MNKELTVIKAGFDRGFDLYCEDEICQACDVWLATWQQVKDYVANHPAIRQVADFTDACDGDGFLDAWFDDMDVGLVRACLEADKFVNPKYMICRQKWAEECLELFPDEEPEMRRNFRVCLAEAYAFLGQPEKCDALFEEIMSAGPAWVLGWVFWSDRHRLTRNTPEALAKAETILQRGLEHAGTDPEARLTLLQRLADVYQRAGREEEAEPLRRECEAIVGEVGEDADFADEFDEEFDESCGTDDAQKQELAAHLAAIDPTLAAAVVGDRAPERNDPCPCGSGKKYKKCCGA